MKRIIITLLIAHAIFFLASCSSNDGEQIVPEQLVNITLRMPEATRVNVYSTVTESECAIFNLWVLEFNSAGALVNDALISGADITRNGQSSQILPELPFKPTTGNKIVCIANTEQNTYPHPFRSQIIYSGNVLDLMNKPLLGPFAPIGVVNPYYFYVGEYLPMYGEFDWSATNYVCEMKRNVVKIQVQLGENYTDVTGNFNAENVTYLVDQLVDHATVNGVDETPYFNLMQKAGATERDMTVYVFAHPWSNTDVYNDPLDKKIFSPFRQHIVLKKTVSGVDSYYRLDFYDAIKKEFMDTKRNHHYIFTIKNVRSEGYTDRGAACQSPGSNIEYSVSIDGSSQHITSNGQYAIATSMDTVYIKTRGTSIIGNVKYVLSAEMAASSDNKTMFEQNKVPTSNRHPSTLNFINTVSFSGTGLTVNSPSAQTSTAGSITDADSPVSITTAANFMEGTITFHLGNIKHTVVVKYRP